MNLPLINIIYVKNLRKSIIKKIKIYVNLNFENKHINKININNIIFSDFFLFNILNLTKPCPIKIPQ